MIDWARVRELHEEIGAEAFDEVVELFLEEVDAQMAALEVTPDDGLGPLLHSLKGAALNLGFAGLGRLCSDGEQAASAGRPGEVDRPEIAGCYAGSREMFQTGWRAQTGA